MEAAQLPKASLARTTCWPFRISQLYGMAALLPLSGAYGRGDVVNAPWRSCCPLPSTKSEEACCTSKHAGCVRWYTSCMPNSPNPRWLVVHFPRASTHLPSNRLVEPEYNDFNFNLSRASRICSCKCKRHSRCVWQRSLRRLQQVLLFGDYPNLSPIKVGWVELCYV